MLVNLLSYQTFKGKDSREWAKFWFYNPKGDVTEVFMAKSDFDSLNIQPLFLDKTKVSSLFANYPQVNLSFNEKGRIDSVSVVK